MGYRSNVRVMTNLEGFEEMQEIAWMLAEKRNIKKGDVLFPEVGNDPQEFFEYYDAQETYLCFGFDWFKWYEDYKEVRLFMDVLALADVRGIPWQFIRVGEDCGDIETEESNNFYCADIPYMNVDVQIVY